MRHTLVGIWMTESVLSPTPTSVPTHYVLLQCCNPTSNKNHPGGCPSKLIAHDKQSIIHQVTTGKLDNAVQATQFINSVISRPVKPQTVRNALKEAGFCSAIKFSCSRLLSVQTGSSLLSIMKTRQWRIGKKFCGVMRQRSIGLDQMGRYMCGKFQKSHYLTPSLH